VYKPVNGTITLPNLYEKVSGGTSSQFLKADGSVDGNLYALAYGGNQNKTQHSEFSRFTSYVQVIDRRSGTPMPNSYEAHNISAFFNASNGMPDGNWWSGFHVRGWGDGYCTWELVGPSSTNNVAYGLRYRTGINDTWGAWRNIITEEYSDSKYVFKTGDTMTGRLTAPDVFITNAPNNWSNIQFGAQNAWNGMINGQWVVGKNPANYFQVCMAGTETANTTRPSKGFSVDTNGYLHTGYISVEINTDNQGDYFYSSNDAFLRRSAWYAALSHLSNKQLTLDLSNLDSNTWYPCIIGAPAYGGTPLRITLFNVLRGNKPSWGSHQQGFSLLLDYEVTGSGWGAIPIAAKLNWYAGSNGGETAFGGRQQNTMASTEIIYLRGGGIYYYRTTNGQALTVQPNGYTWSSGSYNYSAPVKTSQDNSPMERTFDQVYWLPNTLRTTRTFWGQPFNGSQNVSGAMTGITTISASGDITTSANIYGGNLIADAGYLYSRYNGIEVKIGAQNSSYVHITNNANRPYYFDHGVITSGGIDPYEHNKFTLGSSPKYWAGAYISKVYGGANWADYTTNAYIGGQQPNPQTYFGSTSIGLRVAMTGTSTNGAYWSDTLWINGYYGSDVPTCNALHFPRDGSSEMYISSQAYNATVYGTKYRFWSSKNSNKSDAPWVCSTLNASGRVTCADVYSSSWLRTTGQTGWYSESYGGGIYMTDSDQVQVYNNKVFLNTGYRVWGIGGHHCGIKLYQGNHIGINLANASYTWGIYSNRDGNMYIGRRDGNVNNSSGSYVVTLGLSTFSMSGNIVASGEVTAYSDIRLKSSITDLKVRGRLKPKTYVKDGKWSIGFIAQEVQALYPELVHIGTEPERYLSLNYGNITAVLSA
jgi:hypothetical protein